MVIESLKTSNQSEEQILGSKLKEILYEAHGWNPGLTLRNIVHLALVAAATGKRVTIATTNYDTYIETAFSNRRQEMLDEGLDPERAPGLLRWVLPERPSPAMEVPPRTTSQVTNKGSEAEWVEIIYLHGRVAEDAAVEGRIVFSEVSYAQTRAQTTAILEGLFNKEESATLIVGASLTDPPLVHSLATTAKHPARYVIQRWPSDIDQDSLPVHKAIGHRASHLGVKPLWVLDYFQVAQYLEELRLSASALGALGDASMYRDAEIGLAYSNRLNRWHASWSSRTLTKDPTKTHTILAETAEACADLFRGHGDGGELLRVEVWARLEPQRKDRKLSMWASSVGPILDDSARRRELLASTSDNASVLTLLAGRPILRSLESLEHHDSASRWKTFLSVPVFSPVAVELTPELTERGNVPVGVITLATDRRITLSHDGAPDSALRSLKDDPATMIKLKDLLLGAGRIILGSEDLET